MAKVNGERAGRKLTSRLAAIALRRLGLIYVSTDVLTIRRQRKGGGWTFISQDGQTIRDEIARARLKKLAVPPAYEDVLYAEDPRAHIQAIGRDAAGRLQYRYHPDWEKVREMRKAKRLQRLVEALPRIRRRLCQHLATGEPTREFALSAVIELVACSAIRPGSESYARRHPRRRHPAQVQHHGRRRHRHPVLSRQGWKEGAEGVSCGPPVRRHRGAAHGAGAPAVPVPPDQRRGPVRHRARRECVPARDRGHQDLAEGFPHPGRLGCRARGACPYRRRRASAGGGGR